MLCHCESRQTNTVHAATANSSYTGRLNMELEVGNGLCACVQVCITSVSELQVLKKGHLCPAGDIWENLETFCCHNLEGADTALIEHGDIASHPTDGDGGHGEDCGCQLSPSKRTTLRAKFQSHYLESEQQKCIWDPMAPYTTRRLGSPILCHSTSQTPLV